jgi:hypothetical protein
MTPEQEVARRKRAASAARSLLSLESGLAFGAKRVHGALQLLGDDVPDRFPAFGAFLDAIPKATPLGQLRLLCQERLLIESDQILASVESRYRSRLLLECIAVIRAYGAEK